MPVPVIERALELMPHVDFVNAYGLTETSSTIAVLTPDDHRDAIASDDPAVRRRLGSVGRPSAAIELTIRDPFGEELPAGRGRRDLGARRAGVGRVRRARRRAASGSPPATAATSTPRASCSSRVASTTSSCAAARTSRPARSRRCCASTPPSTTSPCTPIPSQEWGEDIGASVVLVGDVDPDELREWVRARLRSTRVPALHRRPHRAAVQRDRQAAAARAQGRGGGRDDGRGDRAVIAGAPAPCRPGDLAELFAAASGDTATVLGGRPLLLVDATVGTARAGLLAGLGAGRRRRRRRR